MTILHAKKLLGKYGNTITDDDIQQLLDQLYGLAEIITDQVKANGSNKQLGVIDPTQGEGTK